MSPVGTIARRMAAVSAANEAAPRAMARSAGKPPLASRSRAARVTDPETCCTESRNRARPSNASGAMASSPAEIEGEAVLEVVGRVEAEAAARALERDRLAGRREPRADVVRVDGRLQRHRRVRGRAA